MRLSEAVCRPLISRYTRLTPAEWEQLSGDFPSLGVHPALPALRHRLRRNWQLHRALRNPSGARLEWHGEAPGVRTLFVSTHSNPLRMLRYLLRAKGFGVTLITRTNPVLPRGGLRDDRRIDRLFPFPVPHRLRREAIRDILRCLESSHVLAAVDLHEASFLSPACLKGRISVNLKPFRLARIAGAPCRPVFLRSRASGLEILLDEEIDVSDERQAAESFAAALARQIQESPFDMLSHNVRIDRA